MGPTVAKSYQYYRFKVAGVGLVERTEYQLHPVTANKSYQGTE